MNIAVLLHGGAGGSGVVATELGLAFAHQGHDVHFVAGRLPFRLGELSLSLATVFYHQVESMSYPLFDAPLTTLAEASKLTEVIEEYDVDVIHAHYAIPHATAAILARDMCRRRPRPAVVTTLHGTAVTAVSRHLADYTHAEMGIRRDITVIPNAVDHRRFKPGGSGELRLRYAHPDEKLLVHVSNFRPVKRVLDVIRIFAEVSESIGSRLLMIGDGPDRPRAVELAHELGVSGRVSFLGSFLRIEDVLAISDLFLLPSAKESFGLAALEAMASGVPVVASRAGGIPEVVVDGVTGYLCEMGDVRGMAEAAIRLLSDPERQQAFAEAARAHAVAEFCEGKVVPLYAGAYGRALSGRRTERQVGTGV
jgi:glycosyltransferase involved in cell wall biosynthesis